MRWYNLKLFPSAIAFATLVLASTCSNDKSGVPSARNPATKPTEEVDSKPVIASFTADPPSINGGDASTLTWNVAGANSISINQGVGVVTGSSVLVNPTATTTYTLTATNSQGDSTAITAVIVADACLPSTYKFPAGPTFAIPDTQTTGTLTRTIPWNPGVPSSVAMNRTVKCTTLSPSTDPDADDGKLITVAIENCPDNQVVFLNPGKYQITTAILFKKSRVTLRGSGGPGSAPEKQTQLVGGKDLLGMPVVVGTDIYQQLKKEADSDAYLTSVALQGTDSVEVRSTAGLNAGDLVVIDQETDPANEAIFSPFLNPPVDFNDSTAFNNAVQQAISLWPLDLNSDGTLKVKFPYAMFDADMPPGTDGRDNNRRLNRPIAQMAEIKSINADTKSLTFMSPLHMAFAPAFKAQVAGHAKTVVEECGVEDLYINLLPNPSNNNRVGCLGFSGAKRSWARNIEASGSGVTISHSLQCTLRDSYVHETANPTPGGAGYGLTIEFGSADNLVENNIVWNFNKVMVAPGSGGGNVYAYNYMDDGWISYHPNFVESGMEASHGSTPHYALFEGNLTFSFGTDPTHGNNIFMTWLRNLSTIHRSAWPPLNAYRVENGNQSSCVPPPGYSDKCEAYSDWAGRAGVIVTFGDFYYNYVGNVIGSLDTPLAPQFQSKFVYENSGNDGVPMWSVGYGMQKNGKDTVDQGVVSTLLRDGNYDITTKGTSWADSAQTIPESLYLCGKPAFFGSYSWPWVDGSNATKPYLTRPYSYYPQSEGTGTFVTPDLDPAATKSTTYSGYQLPAFVRFLQLRSIEIPPASCAGASVSSPPAECSLLVMGNAP